ncbi:DcrB-related protein [Citrobacter sp. BDA59-3]|uniref:DcrB-related protein n=1 Tax=Citrobacter sp. BDA59-3 TaxID=2781952 RepID=UPI001881331B|nr:DcrB-related protein [Citrobacter sp. BDA59-3]QOV70671.1 DcrB-related protein [Citrobacter sp. BDA59-3]
MADYILQEATLALPDVFKDRTMNLFTLNDTGASEFTFVVSRAGAKNGETVQAVAARIARELEVTVPEFRMESTQQKLIDGEPAVELFYQFKNGNVLIFQRQTVILLDEPSSGKKVVCYIGTCPGEFTELYQKQYQDIIASIRFHHNQHEVTLGEMIRADNPDLFFALDTETCNLDVFSGVQALYRSLPLQRAREGLYLLYAQDGSPLRIAPVPDTQPIRYALWSVATVPGHHLEQQLSICRTVNGPQGLASPEQILAFLTRQRTSS